MKETFSDIIDLSIFKSLKYTLFCVSNLLLYACIDVPYVYMPDHAIHTGASGKETSSFLISVIGIVNTLGIVSAALLSRAFACLSAFMRAVCWGY